MSLLHLFSRLRLVTIKPAEARHPNAPMVRSAPQLNGPFLETSLPSWAATTLERADLPREAASFLANRRDTGAVYLVHGVQSGPLQLRIVIPAACTGATELFTHLAEQERVSVICDIDESTQSVELAIAMSKEAAVMALQAPQVPRTDTVLLDEVEMLLALANAQSVPSLIAGQKVEDILVFFCGDVAALNAVDSRLPAEGSPSTGSRVH